ncbi:hypothetical protein D3C87_39980 [compost metagenome]
MKIIKHILLSLGVLLNLTVFGQGPNCNSSACLPSGSYPTTTQSPSTGSCGCLGSTPNQMWISIYIPVSGQLHWVLTQTNTNGTLIDVDFALFGPFTSMSGGCPVNCNATVDCSFLASPTEYIDIPNAVAGQYYNLMITNFNGAAGTVNLTAASNSNIPISTGCNPTVTATATPATCGQPTGSVTATATGPSGTTFTYLWTPGNATTPTVNNLLPGTYTVTVTPSPAGAPATASVTVPNINASFSATATNASCPMGHDGTATANYSFPGNPPGITATYQWNDPAGQTTRIASGLLPGTYVCTITMSNGCVGTASATVGANPVAYSGTSTRVSCPQGSDGTATANMAPVVGTLSYAWSDPASQNTQTAVGLPAGSYTCVVTSNIGCTGTVNVTVTEVPGMVTNVSTTPVTCHASNDGTFTISVSQGTPPYSYSWDHSASTSHVANDLYVGPTTVTVTDALGCVIAESRTLTEPAALQITSITPDLVICPEDSTTLTVTGDGGNGSDEYTFTWKENGTVIGTGTSIVVDPVNSNTEYCVELTETCGSPSTDTCMRITFPTPIRPVYNVNKPYTCLPGELVFTLDTQNPTYPFDYDDPIDSVIVSFGNGEEGVVYGNDSIHYTYLSAGIYTIHVTVTSELGCVTDTAFAGIANVIANPVADFTMSSNPTTIFETVIKMQDKSSANVINWTWSSPGSIPISSTYENPTFHFPEGVIMTYPIQLIVETPEGCVDTTERILSVVSDMIFYAPNAFTPDGDEFNQTWKFAVSGVDEYNFELLIFNRWGEIIWETHDVNSGWDGTYNGVPCKEGAYSWVARLKDVYSDTKKTVNGTINLIK